jgi:hypothetical protein
MEYTLSSITSGTYDIAFRVASNLEGTKSIKVYLDNTLLGSVAPKITGGWQSWTTIYLKDIAIAGGTNQVLKLAFTGGDFNLNWIEVGKNLANKIETNNNSTIKAYYTSSQKSLYLEMPVMAEKAKIEITDMSGRNYVLANEENFTSGYLRTESLQKGIYIVSVLTAKEKYATQVAIY